MDELSFEIGKNIRKYRKLKGLTLEKLAEVLTGKARSTAIPSISSPTSPIGSWFMTGRRFPLCRTSTPTR